MHFPRVLRTKITPPARSARTLVRPRVIQALIEALQYRLTLIQAGAGYGKSTALSALAETGYPLIWYQVTEEDSDPLVFLLHLCHATLRALPDLVDLPVSILEAWDGRRGPLPSSSVIDQYLNALSTGLSQPTLLALDDLQLVESSEIPLLIDRLAGLAPAELHILAASRPPFELPNLWRWRSKGEVLLIDQATLAFDVHEISALFSQHYGYELTRDEAEGLWQATEGWAIALQLIWQGLRSGAAASVSDALAHQATSLDGLFEVLAGEVFSGQPEDVKRFMLISATLREMTPEACDALRGPADPSGEAGEGIGFVSSMAMLAYLRRQELFVVDQAGDRDQNSESSRGLRQRYHPIFHQFLRQLAPSEQRTQWHLRAADYYRDRRNPDETIYHLLQARHVEGAASLLDTYGAELLAGGRLDTLATLLDAMPPVVLHQHPALLIYLGDLARLHSHFEEALGWFQQAEEIWRERGHLDGVGRALRGQARVYLDTVNPSRAEELLQRALRLSEGIDNRESQARLYELLSENKLNAGQVEEAERLRRQAEALRTEGPSDSQLLFRVLLRTGRLEEARQSLEARAEAERHDPVQTPRAHRETLLLLSLIYAFQGQAEAAYQTALEGTQRGKVLNSPFVTAVGHMRQGHALTLPSAEWPPTASRETLLVESYVKARQQFEKAVELSRSLAVNRLRVEAGWGLCRVYGYQGDLAQSLQFAQEAIEIATQAGDEWIASLVRLAMGANLVLAGRYEAAEGWLNRAALGFLESSDPFGHCATRLWQCLALWRVSATGENGISPLAQILPDVLASARSHGYDYLFTRPTLLGPPDERQLFPLLILARDQGWETAYTARLLKSLGLPEIQYHPGYQLRVLTLGAFQVWRGAHLIPPHGWRREKARQLFQILLTYRQAPLDRDQIIEYLWPELDPASAQRNFKVTLNTLYTVLEPERVAGSESAYIVREGTTYGLRPGADLWLDVQAFQTAVQQAEMMLPSQPELGMLQLQHALQLYQGEYLPEARYETWAAAEREHLAVLFLRTADRLSEYYLQQGRFEEAIGLCQRILSVDNCWERAYRQLMLAFDHLGDHGQVARTYHRCLHTLKEELDVQPAPETEILYERLTQNR